MKKSIVGTLVVVASMLSFTCDSMAASGLSACLRARAGEVVSLRKDMDSISHRILAAELTGGQVTSGACTIRALRLGISFGVSRDFASVVDLENTANCYALRIHAITQDCFCVAQGSSYDDTIEDSYIAEYDKLVKVQKMLAQKGIANKMIAKYVDRMLDGASCINRFALSQLAAIEHQLSSVGPEPVVSAMDTGVGMPTVSPMNTGVGTPTVSQMDTGAGTPQVSQMDTGIRPKPVIKPKAETVPTYEPSQGGYSGPTFGDGIDAFGQIAAIVPSLLSFVDAFNTSTTLSQPMYSNYGENYSFSPTRRPQSDITGTGGN